MNSASWNSGSRESFKSITIFCPWIKPEEEIWQLRKKPEEEETDGIELQNRTTTSNDDLSSLDSWTQSVLSKSSVGSLASLDSAAFSSVNTTPADSPASTPTLRRKLKPALKLNLDDVTWTHSRVKKHRSRRLRQNLQASSARVKAVMKQSKTPQFRFRMILLTLFALIVTIVSFTWHMYQRQLLQLTIGNKIRFHEAQRVLHLLTDDGRERVKATLGVAIPTDLNPYHCDIHSPFASSHMCEEWKYRAKLHINFSHSSNLSCYFVHWESLNKETVLRDCIGLRKAYWYGMGLHRTLQWPLQPTPGSDTHAFVTGEGVEQMFGGILDRYWLSSDGVAVLVNPNVSLYVSITEESLCLESKRNQDYPYQQWLNNNALTYTICTGGDMRTLHQNMMLTYREQIENTTANIFLNDPIWAVDTSHNLTQISVQKFANHIKEHTSHLSGFILLDSRWQQREGTLEFNHKTFPHPREILEILRLKGFRILLTVHPYVCLPSKSFEIATRGQYLVSDEWKNVPLLTRWHGKVCGLLDFTNEASTNWFLSRLLRLKKKYGIHGFVFTGGQTTYLPRSYVYNVPSINPDMFLPHYLSIGTETNSLLGSEVGFLTQSFPGFMRLSPRTASWDGLKSVIPAVLTLSILGYPLINPGSIGGDSASEIPSKELYLRWFELAVFLPVVQFTIPPGSYDEEVISTVYRLYAIREKYVLPFFKMALESYSKEAAPLVRPLWWTAPGDPHTQTSDSQFMVGGTVMVAPVLEEGRRARDIYLPAGWWKDHLLHETRRGGKWLHNYPVPLTKVAYFSVTKEPFEST